MDLTVIDGETYQNHWYWDEGLGDWDCYLASIKDDPDSHFNEYDEGGTWAWTDDDGTSWDVDSVWTDGDWWTDDASWTWTDNS